LLHYPTPTAPPSHLTAGTMMEQNNDDQESPP
jgi:hypothetical protein